MARRPEGPGGTDLFCLPFLSYGSAEFSRWPRLAGDVRICPLRCPADRDPGWWLERDTFQAQAADLVDDLGSSLPERFALFGHSDSALLAYEVMVALARLGMTAPVRLIVSASPAPQDAWISAPIPTEDELTEQALIACLNIGSTPLPSMLELSTRALRAQATARRKYKTSAPKRLGCPITAITWAGASEASRLPMFGWSECGSTTFVTLDGAEFRYTQAPPSLLRIIEATAGDHPPVPDQA